MRTGISLAGALAAICVSLAAPAAAWAQTPTNPQARTAFTEGVALLRRERFVEAMPHLEEAVRLDPTPTALFDLALAYRGAGRIAAAVTTFERYLAAPEANAPEARLRAIREELPALLRSIARLRLDIAPAGATVRVDGREAQMSNGELRVDPGSHVLEIEAPGHLPARREVTPQAGMAMVLEIRLQPNAPVAPPVAPPTPPPPAAEPPPTTGTVNVDTSVPGALVRVDGSSRGTGPLTLTLPAGEHRVEVTAAGHDTWARTVNVTAAGSQRISASLTARRSNGWVLPVAIAGGAAVVAGVVVGVLFATRGEATPTAGSWGTVREP